MSVRIINADCRTALAEMPAESVHCIVTSPPYWGLRDYGVAGQMGLERSLGEHIEAMVAVFEECRRVLRKDGTVWLNYGDCYATSPNGRSAADTKAAGNDDRTFRDKPFSTVGPIHRGKRTERGSGRWGGGNNCDETLKPKDLALIPHRLAIALQAAGWWVRADIVWSKLNPMPESVRDRPARAHEYVFLLAKSERYFFDAEAIREPRSQAEDATGFRGGSYIGGSPGPRQSVGNKYSDADTRNPRSVWELATAPFPDAHFATFPPELAERCIKAGCPKGGTVLDPFGGAGTTGLVADRLQRDAILIELNPEYAEMARKRIEADAPMFAEVNAA